MVIHTKFMLRSFPWWTTVMHKVPLQFKPQPPSPAVSNATEINSISKAAPSVSLLQLPRPLSVSLKLQSSLCRPRQSENGCTSTLRAAMHRIAPNAFSCSSSNLSDINSNWKMMKEKYGYGSEPRSPNPFNRLPQENHPQNPSWFWHVLTHSLGPR